MIRPTMSHATNKDDLYKLMSEYATKLEKENAELKTHVETGWIDLLGEMKHQTNTSEDEGFRTGWNSCIHLLDQMAFEMMAKFNVVNSLAQHDKEVAVKAINDVADEMDKIYLHDYERKSVKGEQWYWWCRVYKFMKDKAKQLQEQE